MYTSSDCCLTLARRGQHQDIKMLSATCWQRGASAKRLMKHPYNASLANPRSGGGGGSTRSTSATVSAHAWAPCVSGSNISRNTPAMTMEAYRRSRSCYSIAGGGSFTGTRRLCLGKMEKRCFSLETQVDAWRQQQADNLAELGGSDRVRDARQRVR